MGLDSRSLCWATRAAPPQLPAEVQRLINLRTALGADLADGNSHRILARRTQIPIRGLCLGVNAADQDIRLPLRDPTEKKHQPTGRLQSRQPRPRQIPDKERDVQASEDRHRDKEHDPQHLEPKRSFDFHAGLTGIEISGISFHHLHVSVEALTWLLPLRTPP